MFATHEACTTETYSRILTGEGIAAVRKSHHRHWDRIPIDAQANTTHLQIIPWVAAWTHALWCSTCHCAAWTWRLSWMMQRCENHMTTSPGYMQDIWTLPIVWHSVGPAFCWRHGDGHWFAAGCCCQCVYWFFFSPSPGSKSADFEAYDSNCLHWLCHYVVWSLVVRVPHFISGAVSTHAPSLTLFLSCTTVSPISSN